MCDGNIDIAQLLLPCEQEGCVKANIFIDNYLRALSSGIISWNGQLSCTHLVK